MYHLFTSTVRIERLQQTVVDGSVELDWAQATDPDPDINQKLQFLKCRLDLNFVRPGKDIPVAPEAGKAPTRMGLMLTYPDAPIKAGDHIICIPDEYGKQVIEGTFEIKPIPDMALDYTGGHHLEVQVVETNKNLTANNWVADEEPL